MARFHEVMATGVARSGDTAAVALSDAEAGGEEAAAIGDEEADTEDDAEDDVFVKDRLRSK